MTPDSLLHLLHAHLILSTVLDTLFHSSMGQDETEMNLANTFQMTSKERFSWSEI